MMTAAVVIGGIALAGAAGVEHSRQADPLRLPTPSPFPIRRILLTAPQMEAILKTSGGKPYRRMRLADFSALLQAKAKTLQEEGKPSPRLIATDYQAELRDGAVEGTAKWIITREPQALPWLNLTLVNVAVSSCQWSDGRPACFGRSIEAKPRTLLLVDKPGLQEFHFRWSLRGKSEQAGVEFEFPLEQAIITSFELVIPRQQTVSQVLGAIAAGPRQLDNSQKQAWRLYPSGNLPIRVQIRPRLEQLPEPRPTGGSTNPLPLASPSSSSRRGTYQQTAAVSLFLLATAGLTRVWKPSRYPRSTGKLSPATVSLATVFVALIPAVALPTSVTLAKPTTQPITVYLVPRSTPENSGDYDVFIAEADYLTLINQPRHQQVDQLILSAESSLSINESRAVVTMQVILHSHVTEASILELDLGGIAVNDISLNQKPLDAVTTVNGRLAVPIPGPGQHQLLIRGEVPVNLRDSIFQVTLPGWNTLKSMLSIKLSEGMKQIQVPSAIGSQRVEQGNLLVDHGPGKTVTIQWSR